MQLYNKQNTQGYVPRKHMDYLSQYTETDTQACAFLKVQIRR